jgi:hypothetical protein
MTRLRYAPYLACLLCLLPILLCYRSFAQLWLFGDDWVQLSEMASVGFFPWLLSPFAENFVPLYKFVWAAALHLFDGSYFALMELLWAVHILNLLLFAKVLARLHVPMLAIVCAVLTAGLPWTNIETLTWSVQLTGLLSTAAYFLAWLSLDGWPLLCASLIAAAPLFHARGLANGFAIGLALLIARRHTRLATACLAISAALTAIIYLLTLRHAGIRTNTTTVPHMAVFALHYLALNPLLRVLPLPVQHIGWTIVASLGAIKALIVACGFRVSSRPVRPFLVAAILLDAGYAAILGFGRYHTGLDLAVSYRYQYISWFCFAPFLALLADDLLERIPWPAPKWIAATALLAAWAIFLAWPWRRQMETWSEWRGSETRQIVRTAMPQTPLRAITVGRARELQARYHLH